jgi:hypothetical protein
MTFGGFMSLVFIGLVLMVVICNQMKRDKSSPNDWINNEIDRIYGPINGNLICPHCQTKGKVHMKRVSRVTTSTGKVGGILKTNTKSTLTTVVTQHNCDQCNSTWDI